MTCNTPLIAELKMRRQRLGWVVKDVAERCGIDERFVSDWEHDIGSPRLDAVERWAAALGLKLQLLPEPTEDRPGLQVDWQRRCAVVNGTPVRLTPMEWKALERLAAAPGQLVSHEALFQHLYGADRPYRAQSTAIRVLITRLRRLLPLKIQAQWGRGYIVTGISASARPAPVGISMPAAPAMPDMPRCDDDLTLVANSVTIEAAAIRPQVVTQMRRGVRPPVHSSVCRAEELGIIDRFLAEHGTTHCPDMTTIQHAPLPTLIWDKVKRKWVRLPVPTQHAALA